MPSLSGIVKGICWALQSHGTNSHLPIIIHPIFVCADTCPSLDFDETKLPVTESTYDNAGYDDEEDFWVSSRMRFNCDELQTQKKRCPPWFWSFHTNRFKRNTVAWDSVIDYLSRCSNELDDEGCKHSMLRFTITGRDYERCLVTEVTRRLWICCYSKLYHL